MTLQPSASLGTLAFLTLALQLPRLVAGEALLVKDLNVTPADLPADAVRFAGAAGLVFFPGFDAEHGLELWRSDGTPEGTGLVKDITPGRESSWLRQMASTVGAVIFSPSRPDGDWQLWRSDGTPDGTFRLKSFLPAEDSFPISLVESGGSVFFKASDGVHGIELWKTDGTPGGTVLVRDLVQGPAGSGPAFNFFAFHGKVYFTAFDGNHFPLWKSDGTESGTVKLETLYPRQHSTDRVRMIDDFLYFPQDGGERIWRSDGTPAGTILIFDRSIFPDLPMASFLSEFDGRVVFSVPRIDALELWIDDARGLRKLQSLPAAASPYESLVWDHQVFFHLVNCAELDTSGETLPSLWRTDGTEAGTQLLAQVRAVQGSLTRPLPLPEAFGGSLYSAGLRPGVGVELVRTDGTAEGTRLVKDVLPGPRSSAPDPIAASGGHLFFAARGESGAAVFASDGTPEGTVRLQDIFPATDGSRPLSLTPFGGKLIFSADDGVHGREPWLSDGTPEGTGLLADTHPDGPDRASGTGPYRFQPSGRYLYFAELNGQDAWELWRTQGTADSTVLLREFETGGEVNPPRFLGDLQGTLLFEVVTPDREPHLDLWRSDGTPEGTNLVWRLVILDPRMFGFTKPAVSLGGRLFFVAPRREMGRDEWYLWRTDGTPEGTEPLFAGDFLELTALGDHLFLLRQAGPEGTELWTSDGTRDGTVLATTIFPPAPGLSTVAFLERLENDLICLVYDGNPHLISVLKFDVATGEKKVLREGLGYPLITSPVRPVKSGSRVFFAASDGRSGAELWATDGTVRGTKMVLDLVPGPQGSFPSEFVDDGGVLYFMTSRLRVSKDPTHEADQLIPQQIWRTDGTPEGTAPAVELPIDLQIGGPLVPVKGMVYFPGSDPSHGIELWAFVAPRPAPLRGDANGDGGRGISDVNAILDCLFLGGGCPTPPCAADANGDAAVDVSDAIFLLWYLFLGGEAPPPCA